MAKIEYLAVLAVVLVAIFGILGTHHSPTGYEIINVPQNATGLIGVGQTTGNFSISETISFDDFVSEEETQALLDSQLEITLISSDIKVVDNASINFAIRNHRKDTVIFRLTDFTLIPDRPIRCYDLISDNISAREQLQSQGKFIRFNTFPTVAVQAGKSQVIPLKIIVEPDAPTTVYACRIDLRISSTVKPDGSIIEHFPPEPYSSKEFTISINRGAPSAEEQDEVRAERAIVTRVYSLEMRARNMTAERIVTSDISEYNTPEPLRLGRKGGFVQTRGGLYVSGPITVEGGSLLAGKVHGTTMVINGSLQSHGKTYIHGHLGVAGTATIEGNLLVTGNITKTQSSAQFCPAGQAVVGLAADNAIICGTLGGINVTPQPVPSPNASLMFVGSSYSGFNGTFDYTTYTNKESLCALFVGGMSFAETQLSTKHSIKQQLSAGTYLLNVTCTTAGSAALGGQEKISKADSYVVSPPFNGTSTIQPIPTGSCAGSCNSKSKTGPCYCDKVCTQYKDCCSDFKTACPNV